MATPNDRDTSWNAPMLVVLVVEPDDRTDGDTSVDGRADGLGSDGEGVVHAAVTSAARSRPARTIFDGKGIPLGEPTLAHEVRIGAS